MSKKSINHDPIHSRFQSFERQSNSPMLKSSVSPSRSEQHMLQSMTVGIVQTYSRINPSGFKYNPKLNPRRLLTHPSETAPVPPGAPTPDDNLQGDFILHVNDVIISPTNVQYLVMDLLGQGTFGQVVKCRRMGTRDIVAIKIIKSKPAYYNQGKIEVQILERLNKEFDPEGKHHIVRMTENFLFKKHLCLVFELLSLNLFELLKQNKYHGLSPFLIRILLKQIIEALVVLQAAKVIHCDLKPENILLASGSGPSIKVIDFGSACFENQTIYSYIQSRFYRSPEVIVGYGYGQAIDMWSLGCIAAELFLGLPLFPGQSEFNQLQRITEMIGPVPNKMLDKGKFSSRYFERYLKDDSTIFYKLKTEEQWARENSKPAPGVPKKYFRYTALDDIIMHYPMKKDLSPEQIEKERNVRRCFITLLKGLLQIDPAKRWTPDQAWKHPFVTGELFENSKVKPSQPISNLATATAPPAISSNGLTSNNTPEKQPAKVKEGLAPPSNVKNSGYQPMQPYHQQTSLKQSVPAVIPSHYQNMDISHSPQVQSNYMNNQAMNPFAHSWSQQAQIGQNGQSNQSYVPAPPNLSQSLSKWPNMQPPPNQSAPTRVHATGAKEIPPNSPQGQGYQFHQQQLYQQQMLASRGQPLNTSNPGSQQLYYSMSPGGHMPVGSLPLSSTLGSSSIGSNPLSARNNSSSSFTNLPNIFPLTKSSEQIKSQKIQRSNSSPHDQDVFMLLNKNQRQLQQQQANNRQQQQRGGNNQSAKSSGTTKRNRSVSSPDDGSNMLSCDIFSWNFGGQKARPISPASPVKQNVADLWNKTTSTAMTAGANATRRAFLSGDNTNQMRICSPLPVPANVTTNPSTSEGEAQSDMEDGPNVDQAAWDPSFGDFMMDDVGGPTLKAKSNLQSQSTEKAIKDTAGYMTETDKHRYHSRDPVTALLLPPTKKQQQQVNNNRGHQGSTQKYN